MQYVRRVLQPMLGSDGSCDTDWHYYSGTNSCFYASSKKKIFKDARQLCKLNDADLASIKDQAEMNFVESIVSWVILIRTSI